MNTIYNDNTDYDILNGTNENDTSINIFQVNKDVYIEKWFIDEEYKNNQLKAK